MPRRQRLIRLPIILQLALIASLSMLVPAAHAAVASDWRIARIFLHSAIGCTLILTLLSIAMAGRPPADRTRAVLPTMLCAYVLLPLLLAVPFAIAMPDTGLFNAWWEMLSCMTTTGATLYAADKVHPALHLWRATVG